MFLERRKRREVRDHSDDLIPAIESDVLRKCFTAPSHIADPLAERTRATEKPRRQVRFTTTPSLEISPA